MGNQRRTIRLSMMKEAHGRVFNFAIFVIIFPAIVLNATATITREWFTSDKLWFRAFTNDSDVAELGAALNFVKMMKAQNDDSTILEQNDWIIRVNSGYFEKCNQIVLRNITAPSEGDESLYSSDCTKTLLDFGLIVSLAFLIISLVFGGLAILTTFCPFCFIQDQYWSKLLSFISASFWSELLALMVFLTYTSSTIKRSNWTPMTLTSFGYSFWMSCISVMLKVIAWLYIACIPEDLRHNGIANKAEFERLQNEAYDSKRSSVNHASLTRTTTINSVR